MDLKEKFAGDFYDAFEPLYEIVKKSCSAADDSGSDSLSEKDWELILKIHEEKLWPLLCDLADPSLRIYSEVDSEKKCEAEKFRSSIRSEIVLRREKGSLKENEYRAALKLVIQQHFEFLLTIFEVDKKTNWWLVAALTGGAVIGGTIVYNKFSKEKKEEKK